MRRPKSRREEPEEPLLQSSCSAPKDDDVFRASEALLAEPDVDDGYSSDNMMTYGRVKRTNTPTAKEKYLQRLGHQVLQDDEGSADFDNPPIPKVPVKDPNTNDDKPPEDQRRKAVRTRHKLRRAKRQYESQYLPVGSMRSSILSLANSTIGAGILCVPYAFRLSGLVLGIGLVILCGFISWAATYLLIRSRNKTKLHTYEDLTVRCFGHTLARIVDIQIFLFCFGSCAGYIVAIGDVLHPIMQKYARTTLLGKRPVLMILIVIFFVFPLSLYDKTTDMRYISLFGVACVSYLVLTVTVMSTLQLFDPPSHLNIDAVYTNGFGVFSAFPIILFAFTAQVKIFSVYTELQRKTIRRMGRVVRWSLFVCMVLYLCFGSFGYVMFGRKTDVDFLSNLHSRLPNGAVVVSLAAMGLTVVVGYPLFIQPARFAVEMLLVGNRVSTFRFLMLTLSIDVAALAIAIVLPELATIFSWIGSLSCTWLCMILPGAFYLRVFHGYFKWRQSKKNAKLNGKGKRDGSIHVVSPEVFHSSIFNSGRKTTQSESIYSIPSTMSPRHVSFNEHSLDTQQTLVTEKSTTNAGYGVNGYGSGMATYSDKTEGESMLSVGTAYTTYESVSGDPTMEEMKMRPPKDRLKLAREKMLAQGLIVLGLIGCIAGVVVNVLLLFNKQWILRE